jgi:hypothetical protein
MLQSGKTRMLRTQTILSDNKGDSLCPYLYKKSSCRYTKSPGFPSFAYALMARSTVFLRVNQATMCSLARRWAKKGLFASSSSATSAGLPPAD